MKIMAIAILLSVAAACLLLVILDRDDMDGY